MALALLRPGHYALGPVVVSLTSLRNPLLELGAAVLVALATARRALHVRVELPRRLLASWSGLTLGGRAFAVVLAAKAALTGVDLVRLPGQYFPRLWETRPEIVPSIDAVFAHGNRYAQFERFFERCRRELPEDARVLYFGRGEGQLLAYVLYPRPVFMHPADGYVAWIGHQVLDLGRALPDDDLFPGSVPPPLEAPSLQAFIDSRRITHEVRFVESDLAACRIRAIR